MNIECCTLYIYEFSATELASFATNQNHSTLPRIAQSTLRSGRAKMRCENDPCKIEYRRFYFRIFYKKSIHEAWFSIVSDIQMWIINCAVIYCEKITSDRWLVELWNVRKCFSALEQRGRTVRNNHVVYNHRVYRRYFVACQRHECQHPQLSLESKSFFRDLLDDRYSIPPT